MAQLQYPFEMIRGQAGKLADSGFKNVLSYIAFDDIPFGKGLALGINDRSARLPAANVAVLEFDADFVTGNEIDLDVNGEAIDTVAFDTDQATTLAALAAELDSLDNISAAVTGAREITVTSSEGAVLIENIVVSGGASQADGTVSLESDEYFIGVSLQTHAIEQNLDGEAEYLAGSAVSVLTRGRVYIEPEGDVGPTDAVYLRTEGAGAGKFRADDAGGEAMLIPNARFVESQDENGLAVLEVNLP